MSKFSKDTDVIDSREIIERIEELRGALDGAPTPEIYAELQALAALDNAGRDASEDWQHGVTLINDDYFVEYARELAEDIGAVRPGASWPLSYIDWEDAAQELQHDYCAVEFDGRLFWVAP